MKYFRAIKGDILDRKTGAYTIRNELLTTAEKRILFPTVPENTFKPVEVNRKETYFFFGARFEFNKGRDD